MKNIKYLGETTIGFDLPDPYERRVLMNLDESPKEDESPDCMIRVRAEKSRVVLNDKAYPHTWSRDNSDFSFRGKDYFRYGILTRSIWQRSPNDFLIVSYLPGDEKGPLKCLRYFYLNSDEHSSNKVLINASLVSLDSKGYLIIGDHRAGKTTLALKMMDDFGGSLVSDGKTFLSVEEDILTGSYLPKPVHLRFSSIAKSEKLRQLLLKTSELDATQILEAEDIEDIINNKSYNVDAGVMISRRRFAHLEGIKTLPYCGVNGIILLYYLEEGSFTLTPLSDQQVFQAIKRKEEHRPNGGSINIGWLKRTKAISVGFNEKSSITSKDLEALISQIN